jgi:hypothetical protein
LSRDPDGRIRTGIALSEARWIDSVSLKMGGRFICTIRDAWSDDDGRAGVDGNVEHGDPFAEFGFNLGVGVPGHPVALD